MIRTLEKYLSLRRHSKLAILDYWTRKQQTNLGIKYDIHCIAFKF